MIIPSIPPTKIAEAPVLGLQPLATASPVATLLGCCREAFVKRLGRYHSKATFVGL